MPVGDSQSGSFDLRQEETTRILEKAARYLDEPPCTVTADRCERSKGGPHDYFSEGDYWWPDPDDADGPYIRRTVRPIQISSTRTVIL